jgi:TrpR family trp operon transcriptional repressor
MNKNDDVVAANLSEMATALSRADPKLISTFLYSLFTASEADEIAKRWALVKELAKGRPQRDIAKELGLSLCKITRGSRELKKDDSSFKRVLELAGMEVPDSIGSRRPRKMPDAAEAADRGAPVSVHPATRAVRARATAKARSR